MKSESDTLLYRNLRVPYMHWTLVFLLEIPTWLLFGDFWLVVQANWIRKGTGKTEPMRWALLNLVVSALLLLAHVLKIHIPSAWSASLVGGFIFDWLDTLLPLAASCMYLGTVFKMRESLRKAPILLPVGSGWMTAFFGPVYFQYFLYNYTGLSLPATSTTEAE